MPWKMNADAIEVKDGNPVWVYEDTGKEIAVDGKQTFAKIAELTTKANERKQELDKLTDAVSKYAGIDDPAAALKAMETVKSLDQKKLIDAGEVEKVKAEIDKFYADKLKAKDDENASLKGELYTEKVGGSFAKSKFISEHCVIPLEFIEGSFKDSFKIEDGKVVAYDKTGSKIYSREKPGELADFDEAISTLISTHPAKDRILKAPANSGSGAPQGGGGGGSSPNWKDMSPTERLNYGRQSGAK